MKMPLDTSVYNLSHLRVDGRRWNELRRLTGQIRTMDAVDGSSYLELGHTKVMCVVQGPSEAQAGGAGGSVFGGNRNRGGAGGAGGNAGGISAQAGSATGVNAMGSVTGVSLASNTNTSNSSAGGNPTPMNTAVASTGAMIVVNLLVTGFSGVDHKKRARTDKRIQELESTIAKAFASTLHTHHFPHSTITIHLHVLSQDGSLLAALLNATTLALIDAGIPMTDYIAACTAGSTSSFSAADDSADPLLDLNTQEEQELPYLTVATLGASDRVVVMVCESRVQVTRLEGMLAVGVDGCRQIRQFLDSVVRKKGLDMRKHT